MIKMVLEEAIGIQKYLRNEVKKKSPAETVQRAIVFFVEFQAVIPTPNSHNPPSPPSSAQDNSVFRRR